MTRIVLIVRVVRIWIVTHVKNSRFCCGRLIEAFDENVLITIVSQLVVDVHYISKLNCAGSILQFYALLNSLLNKVTIIAHKLSGRLVSSDQVTNVFSYLHRFVLNEYFKIYQIVLRKVKLGVLKDTPKS